MAYPTISPLPTPPSRQDPANFANEADAFLGALPTFQSQVNAAGDYIEGKAISVGNNFVGVYSAATTYSIGQSVFYNGSYYISLVNSNLNNTPNSSPSQWSSLSVSVSGEFIATSYNETFVAVTSTSNATTVNCETGNVFSHTLTENTTFTFSNPPASGTAYGFTIKLTAGGTHTITWPASVDWAGGTAPDAPASGETNVLVFITHDGGTTWYGFQAGAAMA